nr:hypothetical protein [Nocardia wallacei]
MVPRSSVTAATNPESSAMLRNSSASSVTGARSGECDQRAPSSPSSAGAAGRPGSTVGSERRHDCTTSLRSTVCPAGTACTGAQRAHSCSSAARRCDRA